MYKFILHAVWVLCITKLISCHKVKKDDKLLLSPVELIDLVREEHQKNKISSTTKNLKTEAPFEFSDNEDRSYREPENCQDEETLKNRKVWSRWSKWGECSVTCGSGSISRHRVCVAGRCAPGEREEQRRPCARAPCYATDANVTDELHEVE